MVMAAASEGSPAIGGLLFVGFFVLLAIAIARDRRRHPFLPCRSCRGRGRSDSDWTAGAWGPCPGCSGRGRRTRFGMRGEGR